MILRLFTHFTSSDDDSTSYIDVECIRWEVKGKLLLIEQKKCTRYLPLMHVKSFYEIGVK